MTKSELITKVSGLNGKLRPKDIEPIVDSVFTVLTWELVSGRKVAIRDFGGFEVKERASRELHNPRTGELMTAPAYKTIVFKPYGMLKGLVNSENLTTES